MRDVAVLGAGAMGSGIAQVFARAGRRVRLIEPDTTQLRRGLDRIAADLGRAGDKGDLTPEQQAEVLSRIEPTPDLGVVGTPRLVIEAVYENLDTKLEVFRTLDELCPSETVLASNTSSISITALGAATRRPDRVVGMHFFNPVPLMKLVEVVRGLDTGESTIALVLEEARLLGKTPVVVSDMPGFVSNRLLIPMINEAVFALHEGVASAEEIDTVMRLGMNHPMGPLRLADLIGLDVCLQILNVLQGGFGDPKYRPCPLLRQMVAAGRLGRKTGQGFYTYETEDQPRARG